MHIVKCSPGGGGERWASLTAIFSRTDRSIDSIEAKSTAAALRAKRIRQLSSDAMDYIAPILYIYICSTIAAVDKMLRFLHYLHPIRKHTTIFFKLPAASASDIVVHGGPAVDLSQ